jgi:hypothetical protein
MDEPFRSRFLAATTADERRAVIAEWRSWRAANRRLDRVVSRMMRAEMRAIRDHQDER